MRVSLWLARHVTRNSPFSQEQETGTHQSAETRNGHQKRTGDDILEAQALKQV